MRGSSSGVPDDGSAETGTLRGSRQQSVAYALGESKPRRRRRRNQKDLSTIDEKMRCVLVDQRKRAVRRPREAGGAMPLRTVSPKPLVDYEA
jgi:hypothetical protein